MKEALVKNKNKLIAGLVIVLLLIAAWFYGDGSNKGDNTAHNGQSESAKISEAAVNAASVSNGGEASEVESTGGGQITPTPNGSRSDSSLNNITPTIAETGSTGGSTGGRSGGGQTTPTPSSSRSDSTQSSSSSDPSLNNITPTIAETGSTGGRSGSGQTTPTPSSRSDSSQSSSRPDPSQGSRPDMVLNSTTPSAPESETAGGNTGGAIPDNSCTISIDCKTVLPYLDGLNPKLRRLIPSDGIILLEYELGFDDGATVFDILKAVCMAEDISLEYSYVPAFKTVYIEGIADLYEFDLGDLSGWQYFVNDEFVPVGCSSKEVKDGDRISWRYTTDLGRDL